MRHNRTAAARRPETTLLECIEDVARRFARAPLCYGHGTDNPDDDAAAIVLHAAGVGYEELPGAYGRTLGAAVLRRVQALATRRVRERVPAAYLTGRTWFAGLEMRVSKAVLVPRSPIAELCESGFAPWAEAGRVRAVLDIGTGSGCIAIACAKAFMRARVDAADVSTAALGVAAGNIVRHRLRSRVRAVQSDVYDGLGRRRYDIIVSNPPYVSHAEMRALPREYRHEPALGLAAGERGLDIVARILRDATRHLRPDGLVVVEVGDTEREVRRAWPRVPFTWLEFARGGGGVFLLTAAVLEAARAEIERGAARVLAAQGESRGGRLRRVK